MPTATLLHEVAVRFAVKWVGISAAVQLKEKLFALAVVVAYFVHVFRIVQTPVHHSVTERLRVFYVVERILVQYKQIC